METLSMNDVVFAYRGKAFRELRKRMRLTQEELSQKSGISKSFISAVEKGDREPGTISVVKLATALKVPVFYFDTRGLILGRRHLSQTIQPLLTEIEILLEKTRALYVEDEASWLTKR